MELNTISGDSGNSYSTVARGARLRDVGPTRNELDLGGFGLQFKDA